MLIRPQMKAVLTFLISFKLFVSIFLKQHLIFFAFKSDLLVDCRLQLCFINLISYSLYLYTKQRYKCMISFYIKFEKKDLAFFYILQLYLYAYMLFKVYYLKHNLIKTKNIPTICVYIQLFF